MDLLGVLEGPKWREGSRVRANDANLLSKAAIMAACACGTDPGPLRSVRPVAYVLRQVCQTIGQFTIST